MRMMVFDTLIDRVTDLVAQLELHLCSFPQFYIFFLQIIMNPGWAIGPVMTIIMIIHSNSNTITACT